MKIAILHYHLNRGGVTRVIANQLLSLDSALQRDETCHVAILFGGRADGWPGDLGSQLNSIRLTLCEVPRLDYDDRPVDESGDLATLIRSELQKLQFDPRQTLLHVHNHNLGKTASLPGALGRLASEGYSLLLQIHDFAEDFRPRNYRLLSEALGADNLSARLYPQAAHIHYAVLNRRDETVLRNAGLSAERLHWLPNPVPELGRLPDRNQARAKLRRTVGVSQNQTYTLYPVRGIRRKNVGELLLWSALADESNQFGITLAPLNPVEFEYYQTWRQLASELKLRCHFETGGDGRMSFVENLSAADWILTTSAAEGFGMVFLESWMCERPLAGRNLPEITADFIAAGLRLDGLYDRLEVPTSWFDWEDYLQALLAAYSDVMQSYGRDRLSASAMQEAIHQVANEGTVDFADLNERLQQSVIRRVYDDPQSRQVLLRLNPLIESALRADIAHMAETIDRNKQVIQERYSLEASGRRLLELYRNVIASQRENNVEPLGQSERILDSFLDLNRFRMIRG